MADEVYGFGAEDVRRLKKMLSFYESFIRKQDMRRPNNPATVHGIDYIYGTLTGDLALNGTATITLDAAVDDGMDYTSSAEVYGRWFSASSGDQIGATYNPYTDQWDADRKVCEIQDSDDEDGGSAGGGSGDTDGGDPGSDGDELDGGTP